MKSTVEEIRARFDADVERFSNLETGQAATMDAPLSLELVVQAAATFRPDGTSVLDVGCGAGNYTLKLLQRVPNLDCTLVDLSCPMLRRAKERIAAQTNGTIIPIQSDIRDLELGEAQFDYILAAAVLHHLRTDEEWETTFAKFHRALKPGGSFWIVDLVQHSTPAVQQMMWARYGEYLVSLKDEAYRDTVYAYVEKEDTPKPLVYQLELLRKVGFPHVEVLNMNTCFAAFGGIKD